MQSVGKKVGNNGDLLIINTELGEFYLDVDSGMKRQFGGYLVVPEDVIQVLSGSNMPLIDLPEVLSMKKDSLIYNGVFEAIQSGSEFYAIGFNNVLSLDPSVLQQLGVITEVDRVPTSEESKNIRAKIGQFKGKMLFNDPSRMDEYRYSLIPVPDQTGAMNLYV